MAEFSFTKLLKPAMLSGAMLGLSACAYGGGSYGDGYVNGAGYACDPYTPFDDYYACDNGYGYANIGFGGGWYDSFYYPGYGTYIFDRRGSRYAMQRHHRRHWARQRAEFGSRHARRGDRRAERRRDLTPAQRAERRDRRAESRRNLTPEQRAERRAERNARRATNGDATTGRAALRDGAIRGQRRGETRQTRRANRQGNGTRSERRARTAATQQRGQQARPAARQRSAPVARPARRPAAKARPSRRSSRSEVSRRNVSDE